MGDGSLTVQAGAAGPSPAHRSRVTNGRLPSEVDGRSAWARRVRDLVALHVADLGGADALSQAELALVRRGAVLTAELERMESGFAEAEPTVAQLDAYQRAAGNLRRLLESLGLGRRSKNVTPNLAEYLAAKGRTSTVQKAR